MQNQTSPKQKLYELKIRKLANQKVQTKTAMNQIFNDDIPFIQKVKLENNQPVKIKLDIKAQTSMIKLKTKSILPAMCSIKTQGGQRTGVDLICVLDISGSMQGAKIDLLKSTMKYMLQALTPQDRLSIITFNSYAKRLLGLRPVNMDTIGEFITAIDSIQAGGGTRINYGLQLALKSIKQRKYQNTVTSIFLLSDGQDKGADLQFKKNLIKEQKQNPNLPNFSIHSFGFGSDHDQQLMTNICDQRDGSFYYIKQLQTLDQAFCNALGGLITVAANEISIKIKNVSKDLVKDIKILKSYGQNFQKINEKEYRIKMLHLMSGISKDFIFQLEIPSIYSQKIQDLQRDHKIIQGQFIAKLSKKQQNEMKGQCNLMLTLLNQNQQIPQINQNIDVIQNYLRVKASQSIKQNIKRADENQYEQAQKSLTDMINQIQSNNKARKENVQVLLKDLQQCKKKCSKNEYHSYGKKQMTMVGRAHLTQTSSLTYSNSVQGRMVAQLKSQKQIFSAPSSYKVQHPLQPYQEKKQQKIESTNKKIVLQKIIQEKKQDDLLNQTNKINEKKEENLQENKK